MDVKDLRVGDLLLVKGEGFISEAIECVTNSHYSHVAGYVGAGELIEAEGFRKTGYARLSKYLGKADVYRCPMNYDQQQSLLKLAQWRIGGRYDYLLLAWEFIRYAFGVILPFWEPRDVKICSGLWASIYKDTGIILCPNIRYPTPKDISQSKRLKLIGSI